MFNSFVSWKEWKDRRWVFRSRGGLEHDNLEWKGVLAEGFVDKVVYGQEVDSSKSKRSSRKSQILVLGCLKFLDVFLL